MASFQPPSHLFERNISLNDLDSALDVREIVRKDVVVPEDETKHRYLDSSTKFSFLLPSFQDFPIEFLKFVYSFLVDGHILRELEAARRLNWCPSLCRMITVNTLGDGNCLMHAASIGMWAVNDRYQTLRKTVYEALVEDVEGTRFYHSRWKSEEERQISKQIGGGYERTEEQWNHEWEEVIRHISQTEFPFGPSGAQFGSLEEIHIFVLANILRRTIIVLSDETLRGPYGDSYSPINFGGIYLPLLWDSVDCVKSPLVIGYANGHFTAVVSIEDGKLDLGTENNPALSSSTNCIHAVPLVKFGGVEPLPVHFLYDHEEPLASGRLRQYLDCAKVSISSNPGDTRQTVLVAKLHFSEQPRCMKDLIDGYFTKAREEYECVLRHSQLHAQLQPGIQQPALQIVPCQTPGCSFYGSTETGNRCSKCLNEYLRTLGPACEPHQSVPTGQIQQHVPVTTQQPPNTSAWQQTTTTVQAPPNTSVAPSMTLPVASSAKCRTAGCKYRSVPGRGGLCERCFEAERSAEEMAASMNYMSLASAKHCSNRVNGCEFFGLPEHHNLCSRCYRTFCLRMENTLGVPSPTGLPPSSPTQPTPPNQCQNSGCPFAGVPALYGMCVQCYTGCIHTFITSEGRSVGSVTQAAPHLPAPPMDVRRKNLLPTGGRTKGVLCASPGCCNEGIFQLSDLCAECHARKSGPSPQVRNTPVSAASAVSFPAAPPPPSSMPASAASTHHLTSALAGAIGYYCSNPICKNPIRKEGRGFCQSCECLHPAASLQQPSTRPVGLVTTASSMPPRQNTPAYTSCSTSQTTPGASSSQEVGRPRQVAAPQAPYAEANTGKCAMGCGKPAVQEGGLCEVCFAAAFQLELNRQTVSQPSRQQGAMASGVTGNQVEQRNIVETSSGQNQQQTEPITAKKKVTPLPCISTACMSFGTPEQNGLCDDCYRKKGIRQQHVPSSAESNQRQGSSISSNTSRAQTTAHNHLLGNSSQPASYGLQGPVQVSQPQSALYESGAAHQNSNAGNDAFHGQKCRGTNCTLFGTPETNGYCSRCFLESTIPQSYPHSIPDFPPEVLSSAVASRNTSSEKCRVTGCANFAAQDRHGHCQQCFTRFYPEVVQREIRVQRQMSGPIGSIN